MTSQDALDKASNARPGEEIDAEILGQFLAERLEGFEGPLTVRQFTRGHSNLTYLLSTPSREYVLRRPPFGAKEIKAGHDMLREHRVLAKLAPIYRKAPMPRVAVGDEESPIGAPFYVMDRVEGVILRASPPKGVSLTPQVMRSLSIATVDALAELHAIDIESTGLIELGKPDGYISRQVSGWTERYSKARTDQIDAMESTARWLLDHIPTSSRRATVIHNDFKYDNMVLDPNDLSQIKAVLDWEMSTVGDPRMDLGTTLAYWFTENDPDELRTLPLGLTSLPGNLNRREVLDRYIEKTQQPFDDALFFYVFSLFKVAVIAQQIYFRFARGYTQDPRFGTMIMGVHLLGQAAERSIQTGVI
ncbi:MAG: phosphotransferase family protein [Polyangiaceae bacterium]